jgi:hypothetical protein
MSTTARRLLSALAVLIIGKLSSFEGLARGATTVKVYDGDRPLAAAPTRLFEDAQRTSTWRDMGETTSDEVPFNLDVLWDGEGHNDNAALTVFRHFDSASVEKGLLGGTPQTAWVVDYPLLERIHYLATE